MSNGINWGNNNLLANNPYVNYVPQLSAPAPRYEIIRVNGENGVNAFQMAPNSNVLLLDETAPIIWFVQTDGAGYKSKTPYDISIHTPEPSPEMKTIDERFMSIDKRLKSLEEALLDEPDN